MTTPDTYLSRVDASHVWTICATAAGGAAGMFVIPGQSYGARVTLPSRQAARPARDALARVGYQVIPAAAGRRGHELTIYGWSAQGLESRLTAMRAVLTQLGSEPGATAAAVLGQLAGLPPAELPDSAGCRQLLRDAAQQLRSQISAASGIHAPCDPLARPADTGCTLRLSAAWRAEEAIDTLAARHLQAAWHALALYPGLRQTSTHEAARDTALRQAGITAPAAQPPARDTTPLLRGTGPPQRPAGRHAAPPRRPWGRPGPGEGPARIFPAPGAPGPAATPPPTGEPGRPPGRNLPPGPARRRP